MQCSSFFEIDVLAFAESTLHLLNDKRNNVAAFSVNLTVLGIYSWIWFDPFIVSKRGVV